MTLKRSVERENSELPAAFGYLRVSTDRQAQAELSLPDQEAEIRRFAASNGLRIVSIYQDSMSGTRSDRPGLKEMIDAVETSIERPVAIIVHSLSRIFRDAIELGLFVRALEKNNVTLHSVTQNFVEGESADMVRGMIALFDEYQSAETAKHVRRTMAENARQGFWNGAVPPFGYRTIEVDQKGSRHKKVLAVDPVEAETVRNIFAWRLTGGEDGETLGVKRIVELLNTSGIRTRKGALWGVGAIHEILTRTTYIGRHVYNKRDSKRGIKRPESEHIAVDCPRIIDDTTFERVGKLMQAANPKTGRPKAVAGPMLLTELARCALCGSGMTQATGTGSTGKIYYYYKCAGKVRSGSMKCKGVSVPVDKLDMKVMTAVRDIVLDPQRVRTLLLGLREKHVLETAQVRSRILELTMQRDDAAKRLKNMFDMIANDLADMSDSTLRAMIETEKEKRDAASAALQRIETADVADEAMTEASIEAFVETLRAALEDDNLQFRKSWLRALLSQINVDKKSIQIVGITDAIKRAVEESSKKGDLVRAYIPKWCTRRDSNS